jgi:murein DD-endopeptidase MepM/ murein hydrolase activator NlpD
LPPPPLAAEGAPATSAAASSGGQLLLPVQGVQSSQLVDTFTQARGEGRLHDAIDIMAARGTPVLAVADGRVAKLFDSKPGGLTVYQYDREEKLAYYYAHLDRYAPGLAEGQQLKRGDVLGYVGSTGNASEDAPHLHFAVFVLDADKRWWKGTAVNPYPLFGGR